MNVRIRKRVAAVLLCLIGATAKSAAAPPVSMLEDEDAFRHTPWTQKASVLQLSGGTLQPPPVSRAAVNEAVSTFEEIDDPYDDSRGSFRYDEAILRFDHRGTVYYSFFKTGYTPDDDFATLDFGALMVAMKSHQCTCDPQRWERPPAYDAKHHLVTWMVLERSPNGGLSDTGYADVFMRTGHEYVKAYTRAGTPLATWDELQKAVAALSFPAGMRYEDHLSTEMPPRDHIAEVIRIDAAPEPDKE